MQNCRLNAPDKIVSMDRRMDGQMGGQPWQFQYTPFHFVVGGINLSHPEKMGRSVISAITL